VQAELAFYLPSSSSNVMSGQVVPFAGGWVTRVARLKKAAIAEGD
jgi:hypothetical protein